MGRSAMFLVMGLGMALAMIGFNINKTGSQAVEVQMGYMKYANARNLANTAVHAGLRALDRGNGMPLTAVSYNSGTYIVTDTSSNVDTLFINTRGTYAESTYTMRLKLFFDTKPFPMPNAAIGIRATPVSFSMTGAGCEVNGNNWTADGSALTGSGNLPGVTTMTAADSSTVYAAGSGRINGTVAVAKDTNTPNPGTYINEYIANADYTFSTGTVSGNQTFGSASNPVIVVCDSPADTNFRIRFSGNVTGYGILAVRGSLQVGGTFEWFGLVVCFGESNTVDFGGNGTPSIVGGLIVAQPGAGSASLQLKGSGNRGKVKYSSAAIRNARNIGKLKYYRVLSWYEQ
ncbi:MAG: hypothetical protein V1799_12790 [bacterium]